MGIKTFFELDKHAKPSSCSNCPLFNVGASFANTTGTGRSGVLLLGEALGESEAIAGKPFQGAAGAALTSILHRGGWKRDDFLIANVVNCHPPNNDLEGAPYEVGAIEHCRHFLEETLESHPEIKVIVPMGNIPLHACLGVKGIKNWHGSVTWHERWKRFIVPTFHPSYVMRTGMKEVPTVVFDIARAMKVRQDGEFKRDPVDYLEHPTPEQMLGWVEEYECFLRDDLDGTWLSVDIETPYSADIDEEEREDSDSSFTIIRASMSFKEGSAISFPWAGRYIEYAKKALASTGTKITWNGCPTPNQRLLTEDLVWRKAGDLKVGDKIASFDENIPGFRKRRKYKTGTVTFAERGIAQVSRVCFSDGTSLEVSEDHQWLIRPKGSVKQTPQRWCRTPDLVGHAIPKFLEPWVTDVSADAAYLAGFFDGEGHCSVGGMGGPRVGFAQNTGSVLDRVRGLLTKLGFEHRVSFPTRLKDRNCAKGQLTCSLSERLRFLGSVRPVRLKATPDSFGALQTAKGTESLRVVDVVALGEQEIVKLSVDCSTYILEGFGAHNSKFDKPRLAANDTPICGQHIDAMDAWHFLYSDLPRGLGYVAPFFTTLEPWKHLATQLGREEFYSAQDAWAALAIAKGVKRELDKLGTWRTFLQDFVKLESVLVDFQRTGIGIDENKRSELRLFYETLRENSTKLIQEEVPAELKPWVKKDGYKGPSKEIREWRKANPERDADDAWSALGFQTIVVDGETRYNKKADFNPNSPPQLLEYIRAKYGEGEVPRHKKTGKPTTGEEDLERLARRKKDRVLELIVDAGAAGTKLSNFINNWPTGKDGRVHPTFSNIPATFRLSSKNPNAQNFPSRDAEAQMMRQMIVPGDGWEFLCERDFTGIEAILVGWYAKDEGYIRLAKRGVHDFLAAHMMARDGKFEPISLGLSDNDLTLALKEAKKLGKSLIMPGSAMCYRDGAKPTVHGSNYSMGPVLMYRNHPEVFGSEKEARILQRLYFDLFPSIEKWQSAVVDRAYFDSGVTNAFGYRRKLYNVKRWAFSNRTGKWELVWADDAKKAIATIPQGTAAGIIRRAMLTPAFSLLRAEGCAMIQIHDSLLCRARDRAHVDWVMTMLEEAMVWPIPELGGLTMLTEGKFAKNWGTMKEYGGPEV